MRRKQLGCLDADLAKIGFKQSASMAAANERDVKKKTVTTTGAWPAQRWAWAARRRAATAGIGARSRGCTETRCGRPGGNKHQERRKKEKKQQR